LKKFEVPADARGEGRTVPGMTNIKYAGRDIRYAGQDVTYAGQGIRYAS
jgi:hypothetical protein